MFISPFFYRIELSRKKCQAAKFYTIVWIQWISEANDS